MRGLVSQYDILMILAQNKERALRTRWICHWCSYNTLRSSFIYSRADTRKTTTKVFIDAIIESLHQFRYILIAPCKGIRIRKSRKCLPVESGIRNLGNFGLWDPKSSALTRFFLCRRRSKPSVYKWFWRVRGPATTHARPGRLWNPEYSSRKTLMNKNPLIAAASLACLEIKSRNEEAIDSKRNIIYSLKVINFLLYQRRYFLFVPELI